MKSQKGCIDKIIETVALLKNARESTRILFNAIRNSAKGAKFSTKVTIDMHTFLHAQHILVDERFLKDLSMALESLSNRQTVERNRLILELGEAIGNPLSREEGTEQKH